ncbi:hypothetical protein HYH03_000676 [Edaphochlamys debaryana]|uniref:Uncharacterized protein n=1 Tax=Edaphochlamys debaryana TaxID=47281 RepID=A0A835YQU1_9CHLO|nr:hypothetical protein HYH03_000676 [Edaphochlamys debaryana]|eukprot:KAG2502189.1 hypothetical protein HYH03_000676 [Edaphochlamys debaryana]
MSSRSSSFLPKTKGGVALLSIATIVSIAAAPVVYRFKFGPKIDVDKPLPRNTATRGAYVNTGSRDAGPDRPISREDIE